jgi:hypothetical protein
MLKCKRSEIFMCLQSVFQQKEGWRILIENDGNRYPQQLLFATKEVMLCKKLKFIFCRFCKPQI